MNQNQIVAAFNGLMSDVFLLVGLTLGTIFISNWFLVGFPTVSFWLATIAYSQTNQGKRR